MDLESEITFFKNSILELGVRLGIIFYNVLVSLMRY